MTVVKTRSAVFITTGSLMLASVFLSRFNKRWLWLGGLTGACLIESGITGFSSLAYLFEKYKLTKPDYGHYEEERLRNIHKLRVIRKMRRIKREVNEYLKEAEAGRGI